MTVKIICRTVGGVLSSVVGFGAALYGFKMGYPTWFEIVSTVFGVAVPSFILL